MIECGIAGFYFASDLVFVYLKKCRKLLLNTLPEPPLRGLF